MRALQSAGEVSGSECVRRTRALVERVYVGLNSSKQQQQQRAQTMRHEPDGNTPAIRERVREERGERRKRAESLTFVSEPDPSLARITTTARWSDKTKVDAGP